MLEPAVLDTLWTVSVTSLLLGCTALALAALPWSDHEIKKVHEAAVGLLSLRPHARSQVAPR